MHKDMDSFVRYGTRGFPEKCVILKSANKTVTMELVRCPYEK